MNFTNLIINLQKIKNNKKKIKIIKNFLENNQIELYDFLITILPKHDKDRIINFKEKNFSKFIINEFNLNNIRAKRILNYNDIKENPNCFGDYSKCISLICKDLCSKGEIITFNEIRNSINIFFNKKDNFNFLNILKNLNYKELEIFIRIIIKEMKIGIGIEKIFNIINSNLINIYRNCNNLKICCDKYQNYKDDPNNIIEPHIPIQPSLASKLVYSKIVEFCNNNKIIAEIKYDGERLLIHKNNNKITLFSRNCINVTNIYKNIITDLQKSIQCKSCILDSEIIVLNKFSYKKVSFGKNKLVASNKNNINDSYNLCGNS